MNTDNILETLKVTPQNVSNVIKSYSYIIDERYKDIPTIDVLSANMIYSCLIV